VSRGDSGRVLSLPISRLGKQIAEVAAALNANGVGFALIGGLALASHKVVRATQDVDLLAEAERADDVEPLAQRNRSVCRKAGKSRAALTITPPTPPASTSAAAIGRSQDAALLFAGELPPFGGGRYFRIGRRPRISCYLFRRGPSSSQRVIQHQKARFIHQCFRFRVKISHDSILPFVL
jgi:hypothetical protein